MGQGTGALDAYYREQWAGLTEEQREIRQADAARCGCVLDSCGVARCPTAWITREKDGRRETYPIVRPLHYRIAARAGVRWARAYCEENHIPWGADDGAFRVWEADWLARRSGPQGQQRPRPTYRNGPGADTEEE